MEMLCKVEPRGQAQGRSMGLHGGRRKGRGRIILRWGCSVAAVVMRRSAARAEKKAVSSISSFYYRFPSYLCCFLSYLFISPRKKKEKVLERKKEGCKHPNSGLWA